MKSPVTVALLGRNPISLEGLARILAEQDFHVVETGDEPANLEKSRQASEDDTHLLLVDDFVEARGAEFVRKLRTDFPGARLIILVDTFDLDTMIQCFREGAHAYIVKKISVAPLITSLRLVAMGEKVMPSFLAEVLPEIPAVSTPTSATESMEAAGLSMREVQILTCLVAGQPNKVISRQLNISEATVKVHVKAILRKVGVQNRTQAAIWAVGEKWANSAIHKIADDTGFAYKHQSGAAAA